MTKNSSIACDLTVLPVSIREQTAGTMPDIFQSVQEVQELSNGYAFQFPNESGMWMSLAHFVERERQCCPFFHIALEVEPNGGPIWLRMTGDQEVKQLLAAIWHDLQETVPRIPGAGGTR